MDIKTAIVWASIPAAMAATATSLEYFGLRPVTTGEIAEDRAQIAANTRSLQLARWQYLVAKRRNQGLDATEQAELCGLAVALHLRTQGCT
jgi:hypothetical protein